jgi:hypothetical protein
MNQLDKCSYSHLQCPGCKHSGDITSAPYQNGGVREDVLIDLKSIHKKTKYIGIICFNFTTQSLSDCCDDASVFVADPSKSGNGPGGLKILCAAALKCKSSNNLAGIVVLSGGLRRLMLCDQEIFKSTGNNSETTQDVVSSTILSCLGASGLGIEPSKPKLSYLAVLGSVFVSNTIIIESGGDNNVSCYTRNSDEKKSTFFQRVWAEVKEMEPVLIPTYDYSQHVNQGDVLMVLGGELEVGDCTRVLVRNRMLVESFGRTLLLVNIRSNQETLNTMNIQQATCYTASTNTGDILNSMASLVEKCLEKRKEDDAVDVEKKE